MKNILLYITGLILALSSCSRDSSSTSSQTGTTASDSQPEKVAQDLRKTETPAKKVSSDIKWLSYEEAANLAEENPKKIFVDVYTDWCGWCKRMDRTTLKDPEIGKYINTHYYPVKLNAESQRTVSYKGQSMTEQDLAVKIFGATGYPTTVYLDKNQNVLQPIPGFMEAEMMYKVLNYFGEDHYKTTSWEMFQASFKPNETNTTKE